MRPTTCSICLNLDDHFRRRDARLTFRQLKESAREGCERCSLLRDGVEICVPASKISDFGCLESARGEGRERGWTHMVWVPENGWHSDRIEFELFTLPGQPKPFPGILPGSMCGNTASEDSLLQAEKWILSCCSSHENCSSGSPSPLPKRVIDTNLPYPRLYETHNELAHYACLSHCWGTSRPTCATMSRTLEANQRCIEWESMPRTFRDAIHFTRRLGIRFIWIDSICIIQDDETDWREQSAAMASIYQNAYLTLCATSSLSDDDGCYSHLRPDYVVRKMTMVKEDRMKYDVYFRVFSRTTRRRQHLPDWDRASMGYSRQKFPLMTRAWAYQERLISPRLLHFTSGELMWECSELRSCECTPTEERRSPFFRYHSEKKNHSEALTHHNPGDIQRQWWKMVEDYSSLDLSFEKDKLPALSGVAKQIQSSRKDDEYLAGLWKNTLIDDLRWYAVHGEGKRPMVWRAPTWSWASVDGLVFFHPKPQETHVYSRLLQASTTLSGPDSTGEVSAGFIVLSGPVISATMVEAQDRQTEYALEAAGIRVPLQLDSNADVNMGRLKVRDTLYCLRLMSSLAGEDLCLVLKAAGTTPIVYERVGHLEHSSELLDQNWFQSTNADVEVRIV